jgi:ATP-dependent RNA helicase DeaD
MPPQIRKVAARYLKDPIEIQVESNALSAGHIQQRWLVVPARHKLEALQRVLRAEDWGTTLVFARTRVSCMEVAEALSRSGLAADALHGDLSQAARERVLGRLRSGDLKLLVATDVAARGLDVGHITHVINLDLPESMELYVHRIGRTGRAGRDGIAISLATPAQQRFMSELQRRLGVDIKRVDVPSDAEIIERRRSALADGLDGELGDLDNARLWLDEIQEQRGWPPEETALRAPRLLASKAGVSLSPIGDCQDEPPEWARKKVRSPRPERPRGGSFERSGGPGPGPRRQGSGGGHPGEDGETLQLYIAVGRRHGTRPSDLVGAIAGETGIPGAAIGRIHIADGASFVDMPADMARHIVGRFDKIEVRGIAASVDLSRTSPPGEGRSQRPAFSHGPGPRGGGDGPRPAYARKFGGGPGLRRDFSKGRRPGKVRSKK